LVHREIAEIKESRSLGSQGDRRDQGGKISWFNREIAEIKERADLLVHREIAEI
jgi:hypothetical protein